MSPLAVAVCVACAAAIGFIAGWTARDERDR